jgi:hypothetical protein
MENYATCGGETKPLDIEELKKIFSTIKEPEGIVLLPNGSGFDVYKFPLTILKGAISLMQCKSEPKIQSASPTNSAMAEICPKCKEDGVRIVDTYGNDVCTHCGYEYSGKLHQ